MKYIIKWENKFSHETGFVGDIDRKNLYFVNAEADGAKKTYKTLLGAQKAVKFLTEETKEAENNSFTIVEEA